MSAPHRPRNEIAIGTFGIRLEQKFRRVGPSHAGGELVGVEFLPPAVVKNVDPSQDQRRSGVLPSSASSRLMRRRYDFCSIEPGIRCQTGEHRRPFTHRGKLSSRWAMPTAR